jgi:chloramphenicol-sensitive protein RarD
MKQGLFAAAGAYLLWGLFPIYWKALDQVPALQIMAHRIVWCALLVFGWLAAREGLGWIRVLPAKVWKMLTGSALLIAGNWWLYIWAVNAGHIVETSLGYFINPLVSILLGVLVLGERLNPRQVSAVVLAALGVAWLTWQGGRLPWIALALALSFGGYGLLRKLAPVPAIQGLAVESGLLFLPALGLLAFEQAQGRSAFLHGDTHTDVLLVVAGLITALPLVLFAFGARRIPLTMVGILQYLAPSLQLIVGVSLFGEPFTTTQALGFSCIWAALAVYAIDGLVRTRLSPRAAPAVSAAPRD